MKSTDEWPEELPHVIEDELTLVFLAQDLPPGLGLWISPSLIFPWSCAPYWLEHNIARKLVQTKGASQWGATVSPDGVRTLNAIAFLTPLTSHGKLAESTRCPHCGLSADKHPRAGELVWTRCLRSEASSGRIWYMVRRN